LFETNSQKKYESNVFAHNGKALCYLNNADLQYHGWQPQGRKWEN